MRIQSLRVFALLCLLGASLRSNAQDTGQPRNYKSTPLPIKSQDPKKFIPLDTVVNVVEGILVQVKGQIGPKDPQLTQAEFDFQTITTNDTKFGLNVFILTVEGEHEKDVTQETDFTYSIPTPPPPPARGEFAFNPFGWVKKLWDALHVAAQPKDVAQDLPTAIIAAVDSTRLVQQFPNPWGADLSHRKFVITLTFQVKNTADGSFDSSKLIQVGPEGKYTHTSSATQTLKLTFEDPAPAP